MKPLALIACMAANRVIGRDGAIPWKHPEDMRRFKALTMGHAIIMGRKTYESIGRPLPGRTNVVISGTPGWSAPGVVATNTLPLALLYATARDPEPFVIGGAQVYAEALPLATVMHLTTLHDEYEGDVLFPEVSASEWSLAAVEDMGAATFRTWRRKP